MNQRVSGHDCNVGDSLGLGANSHVGARLHEVPHVASRKLIGGRAGRTGTVCLNSLYRTSDGDIGWIDPAPTDARSSAG